LWPSYLRSSAPILRLNKFVQFVSRPILSDQFSLLFAVKKIPSSFPSFPFVQFPSHLRLALINALPILEFVSSFLNICVPSGLKNHFVYFAPFRFFRGKKIPSFQLFFQIFDFPQQNANSVTYRRLGAFLELCLNIPSSLIIKLDY
jgi:hypothetical protein